MRTFKCDGCYERCCVTIKFGANPPCRCHHDDNPSNWHEVEEETVTNCNQLPKLTAKVLSDWCTVGATCYDYGTEHYFKVTGIDDEKAEVSIRWYPKGLVEVISYSLFTEYARPARKRQFNEHEILDLVGKALSAPSGEWRSLILWASDNEVITHYRKYSANALMAEGYTIDGKPCYVLEHQNDKGEWVK